MNDYTGWVKEVSRMTDRPAFNDIGAGELKMLEALVRNHQPSCFVEVGPGYGLSTRLFLESTHPRSALWCIQEDLSHLKEASEYLSFSLERVNMIEKEIGSVKLDELWRTDDRVLLYYDARGAKPMRWTLSFLSSLPVGSIFVANNVWYSPRTLTYSSVPPFFDARIMPSIDPSTPTPGKWADYWDGGTLFGYEEVIPLSEYLEEHQQAVQHNHSHKLLYWRV